MRASNFGVKRSKCEVMVEQKICWKQFFEGRDIKYSLDIAMFLDDQAATALAGNIISAGLGLLGDI